MAKFHLSIDNEKTLCGRRSNIIGATGWLTLQDSERCKICTKKFIVLDSATLDTMSIETPATDRTNKQTWLEDISKDMKTRIINAMKRTFDAIASDVFQCRVDCGEVGGMPQIEVIEVVCDADHIKTHGGDEEAYQVFNKMAYNDMKKLGKVAFPFKTYC